MASNLPKLQQHSLWSLMARSKALSAPQTRSAASVLQRAAKSPLGRSLLKLVGVTPSVLSGLAGSNQTRRLSATATVLAGLGYRPAPKALPGWREFIGESPTGLIQEQGQPLFGEQGLAGTPLRESPLRRPPQPEQAPVPQTRAAPSGAPPRTPLSPAMKFEGSFGGQPMEPVDSSNVHSIGYDEDSRTLFVRYLGGPSDSRAGPGALYEYFDVPASLWHSFQSASSKGKWVWDNLRIRGTVSGHRYNYDLTGITGGYVPRRAQVKLTGPGVAREFFIPRSFGESQIRGGRLQKVQVRSRLPEEAVGTSRFVRRGKR